MKIVLDGDFVSINESCMNVGVIGDKESLLSHLSEIGSDAEKLIESYNSNRYQFPEHIAGMSINEIDGKTGVLLNDLVLKYEPINEACKDEIKDLISSGAYATALLKINSSAKLVGFGSDGVFGLKEQVDFYNNCSKLLFRNTYKTNVLGKLVESLGKEKQLKIFEGSGKFLRGTDEVKFTEDWLNEYSKNTNEYVYEPLEINEGVAQLNAYNEKGDKYLTIYEGVDEGIFRSGLNLRGALNEAKFLNSYREGSLCEYEVPFQRDEAAVMGYSIDGKNSISLRVLDRYGNGGILPVITKISAQDFYDKYKALFDKIEKTNIFEDRIDLTNELFSKTSGDVDKYVKLKKLERNSEREPLSYKVQGYVPLEIDLRYVNGSISKFAPDKFVVKAQKSDGRYYNILYQYNGSEDLEDMVAEMQDGIDDIIDPKDDFKENLRKSYDIFRDLSSIGTPLRAYPLGISSAGRNYNKNVVEDVQVTDIAPKVDQEVGGMITVKMRKKKEKSPLKISSIKEQDEFLTSKGFIKNAKGEYHMGNYFVESVDNKLKVVYHK